jgi:hypothetical protein
MSGGYIQKKSLGGFAPSENFPHSPPPPEWLRLKNQKVLGFPCCVGKTSVEVVNVNKARKLFFRGIAMVCVIDLQESGGGQYTMT